MSFSDDIPFILGHNEQTAKERKALVQKLGLPGFPPSPIPHQLISRLWLLLRILWLFSNLDEQIWHIHLESTCMKLT